MNLELIFFPPSCLVFGIVRLVVMLGLGSKGPDVTCMSINFISLPFYLRD